MTMCRTGTNYFFFNDTATTEIYTLSLHDALPIYLVQHRCLPLASWQSRGGPAAAWPRAVPGYRGRRPARAAPGGRSEEHTSELQSRLHLVCRLLLEKKKQREVQLEQPSAVSFTTC